MQGEANRRRPAPFPLGKKSAHLRGSEGAENDRVDRAFEGEPEIVGRVEKIAPELARFMAQTELADHGAVAVPGKVSGQFEKRHALVTEALHVDAANEAELRRGPGKIRRTGKLEKRR